MQDTKISMDELRQHHGIMDVPEVGISGFAKNGRYEGANEVIESE